MPTPGSHGYDVRRTRLPSASDDDGVNDVLLCEDPDAPGGAFLHWLVTGIDPSRRSLGEGEQLPGATVWENDFGERGYGGPRPPAGDDAHRYFFRLFALGAPVDDSAGADRDQVRAAVEERRLAAGTLVGLFAR